MHLMKDTAGNFYHGIAIDSEQSNFDNLHQRALSLIGQVVRTGMALHTRLRILVFAVILFLVTKRLHNHYFPTL
jgi:hypothetical protein